MGSFSTVRLRARLCLPESGEGMRVCLSMAPGRRIVCKELRAVSMCVCAHPGGGVYSGRRGTGLDSRLTRFQEVSG